MKKNLCFIVWVLSFSSCADIKEKDLPAAAHSFISTYFPDATFSHGEKSNNDETITLEVNLSNGVKLEFTKSGDWLSVDCRHSFMPEEILLLIPQEKIVYFTKNHLGSNIMKIRKEINGYKININSPTGDFHFTSDGSFIRYDQ